jgi:hypothetical protein
VIDLGRFRLSGGLWRQAFLVHTIKDISNSR